MEERWWTDADKPFQFLAACMEWRGYLSQGIGYVCSLPITVDGSCNGYQHLAAMLRDEVSGEHVNLVPKSDPADLYAAVARTLNDELRKEAQGAGDTAKWAQGWLECKINRKDCKQPVMAKPYGMTGLKFRKELRAIGKRYNFGKDSRDAVEFLYHRFEAVLESTATRPSEGMKWLQSVAKFVGKLGKAVEWTTPSGFYVSNTYHEMEANRVTLRTQGKTYKLTIANESTRMDKRKQERAIVANFVHSMDASALVLTINAIENRGIREFTSVHDNYGTLACDMPILLNELRQAFVKMYSENDVLEQLAERVKAKGITISPPPGKGNLDLTGVLTSDYFFA
jgi:DNA-directed RNA polymerase